MRTKTTEIGGGDGLTKKMKMNFERVVSALCILLGKVKNDHFIQLSSVVLLVVLVVLLLVDVA